MHGVRYRSELAYRDYIEWELTHHEYLGEQVREQLVYFPTVTRERFRYQGRVTALIETGKLFEDIDVPPLEPRGGSGHDLRQPGDARRICRPCSMRAAFKISPHVGEPGDYVIERAFVAR